MNTTTRSSKHINLKNQAISQTISMKHRKNNAQGFINPRIKQLSIVSLAMTSCPLGVATATLNVPTTPFRGRGRRSRWHQGWICPIVRWIESGLMNGAAGSMVHGGKLHIFFIMLPRAADAQCPGDTGSRCTQQPPPPETDEQGENAWANNELQNFWRAKQRMSLFWFQDST